MRRPNPILVLFAILASVASGQPSSFDPSGSPGRQIRWTARTIRISLSTSLTLSPSSLTPESDVVGAVQRALNSWSTVSNITFVVVSSKLQSISPIGNGDGVNLITIAPTAENLAIFGETNNAARTRVFYDPATGAISEADIVINPYPYSTEGSPVQFSTDGTPGTYDLESTLAHEIGHLLGLGHSSVIAATMQASQGLNGTYGLPAITGRTLSEADRVAVRSIYGPCENLGSVEGRILSSFQGTLVPAAGTQVWIEDVDSGRVVATGLTASGGRFSISCVPAGDYRAMAEYLDGPGLEPAVASYTLNGRQRAFRSMEINGQLRVAPNKITPLNYILLPQQNSLPALSPRLLGLNAELSTVALPLEAGTKQTLYLAGEGVDQVPGSGFTVSSPFITIDPGSLTLEQFHNTTPVISLQVTVAADAPPGDYSIRLQSNSGELGYLVGGLTIIAHSEFTPAKRN
jgi:hypothetical protein